MDLIENNEFLRMMLLDRNGEPLTKIEYTGLLLTIILIMFIVVYVWSNNKAKPDATREKKQGIFIANFMGTIAIFSFCSLFVIAIPEYLWILWVIGLSTTFIYQAYMGNLISWIKKLAKIKRKKQSVADKYSEELMDNFNN